MRPFLLFLLISLAVRAQNIEPQLYSRVRIWLDGRHIHELLATGVCLDHGLHRGDACVENDISSLELQWLQAAGFRYDVLIDNVSQYYETQNKGDEELLKNGTTCPLPATGFSFSHPSGFSLGTMGGYFTYQEMLNQLDSMAVRFPHLISARQAINSNDLTHEGRPIYYVKISDNPNIDEPEPRALYNALHHAREALSLSQLIYFMWYLLENYDNDPNIRLLLDNTELYFVPCVNPDGYIYNQTTNPNGGGMWRKNRRNNGSSFGVDLNRNYGYNWAFDNNGSSGNPSSDTYRGATAFSEAETRNLRDLANAKNFTLALNYHTYGAMLIYPWAFNGQETPDSLHFRRFSELMSAENRYITGTGTTTVGYNSNGDADDWFYGEQQSKPKVYSLTPEVSSGYGFWPPSHQITTLCREVLWQNLSFAYLLLNFAQVEDQSSPVISQINSSIAFQLTRYGFASGDFTVGLRPISTNILSVGGDKIFTINQIESAIDSISIALNPSTPNGATVVFELLLQSAGGLLFCDTLTKVFGAYSLVLDEQGLDMQNWNNMGTASNWQTTTATYYSAPSCITDSPTGNYANNTNSSIVLKQAIDLRQISDARLNFWAKWNLEDNYDYVQVMAAGSNGVFVPLCGLYTNLGSVYQDFNEPLYDAQQSTWVQEEMSLNDFLGDSAVVLRIRLVSDQWINADGFYFDDMRLSLLPSPPVSVQEFRRNYPLLGQNRPNPASEQVFIPVEGIDETTDEIWELRVVDVLGRQWHRSRIERGQSGLHIDISAWPKGTYFYQLYRGAVFYSEPKRLLRG